MNEAKLDNFYEELERAQERFEREDIEEKRNLENLAENMPQEERDSVEVMMQEAKLKKVMRNEQSAS